MPKRAAALVMGASVSLGLFLSASGAAASGRDHEKDVRVTNLPLDANGQLKVAGAAVVSGTVAATQSGPWAVALDPSASTSLGQIAAATSGLRYDADGNLQVAVSGGGSSADPSVADRAPFGFSFAASIPGGSTVDVDAGDAARVTAYSFRADHDVLVLFSQDGSTRLAVWVKANEPAAMSFHHALRADRMSIRCLGGDACVVMHSVAAY